MASASCSIKYLKVAYIGKSVRLTGGKDTVRFDNKPLTNVEILNYDSRGFELNHSDLPKKAWLDFGQLPLKDLTIVNGLIQDEITFAENIIWHQTEFVKTDSDEYKMALSEFQLDSKLVLLSPNKLAIGDKVISAQCKESIELVFLGNFFSTIIEPVYPTKTEGTGYYRSYKQYDYSKEPVFRRSSDPIEKRAYFLRKHEISANSKPPINLLPVALKKHLLVNFLEIRQNYSKGWEERAAEIKERTALRHEEIVKWCKAENIDHVWELVKYPVTNKYVKEMMVVGKSDVHSFYDNNQSLINSIINFPKKS